jgi:HK97 family phage portal protein
MADIKVMRPFRSFIRWWRGGITQGQQHIQSSALRPDLAEYRTDQALQLSAVWACVKLLVETVGTLPLFVYRDLGGGRRELAREHALWQLLNKRPNQRMTRVEFWECMMLNLVLRGNAYARFDRNHAGKVIAMWPVAADQVQLQIQDDGSLLYGYRIEQNLAVVAEENMLHLKLFGNGTQGLSVLEYARTSLGLAHGGEQHARRLFSEGGKPTGVLMVDHVLSPEQREAVKKNFKEMRAGAYNELFVLEANMRYQPISLTPIDMQMFEQRRFAIEDIARWFGVPSVLINDTAKTTTWGTGVGQIVEGFYKFGIRPYLVRIEQAIEQRVMNAQQRAALTPEFNIDALLRASFKERMEGHAIAIRSGIRTPNEARQLENDPPQAGGDELIVQAQMTRLRDIERQHGLLSEKLPAGPA